MYVCTMICKSIFLREGQPRHLLGRRFSIPVEPRQAIFLTKIQEFEWRVGAEAKNGV